MFFVFNFGIIKIIYVHKFLKYCIIVLPKVKIVKLENVFVDNSNN